MKDSYLEADDFNRLNQPSPALLGPDWPLRIRLLERAVLALETIARTNEALVKRLEEME